MDLGVHIWARQIWSSRVSLERSCKMQFRRVDLALTLKNSDIFWDTLTLMLLQDGNGFINRMELRHVMMNLGEKMSEEECDALVDVRPHLSNFKSNFAEENQNTMVGLLDLVKIDQMLQKLKKINIEMTALLTECGQTVFGFTRVLRIIFNLLPS